MISHIGLVLHVQVGNNSLYNYFNNPASGASSHFWASKVGYVEQYVDTDLVAWAEVAGNPNYLSVETEGFPNEPLTPAQISSVASLLLWVASTYNVPLVGPVAHGQPGFTPHCNPDGTPDPAWGNHSCPDPIRLGQMADILALANAPTQTTEDEMDSLTVTQTDGTKVIVSHFRTPSDHYIEMTRKVDDVGQPATVGTSLIDVTQQYPQFEAAG